MPQVGREGIMSWCENRLLILGAKSTLKKFQRDDWEKGLRARFVELIEISPTRFACSFETRVVLAAALGRISRRWPTLTFVLDYEMRGKRIKGLVKLQAGTMESCAINF
jgi:hypothetical protein